MTHWADGGRTSLANLVLLCRRHHRMVHEGGVRVDADHGGDVTFVRCDGRRIDEAPPLMFSPLPALPGVASARGLPCWDGTRFNLGYVIDVLRPQPSAR
jgi:hypothetical protein